MTRRTLLHVSFFAFALSVLSMTGCSKGGKSLDDILTNYHDGKKDVAVDSFLTSDWKSKPAFADGSPMNLTEAQFAALTVDEKDKAMKLILEKTNAMRGLAQAVVIKAQDLAKTDPGKAKGYFENVVEMGKVLNQPDRMKLTQLVGQAVQQIATRELANLK